jgi:RNA polymerase sigma-70 factor (ECF subfamily)
MESAATHESVSDDALLRAIASGQSDAIGPLYARYAPTILGMAVSALGRAAAEEIVQEVFVAVWTGARSFDAARGPVRPWLLQIAHYRIANELRRRRRKPEIAADGTENDPRLARIPDPAPDLGEQAWLAYRQEALRRALEKLPAPQRQALGMSFFDELSHAEIARLLGLPLGTAKARIRSGLKSLRVALAPLVAVLVVAASLAAVWLSVTRGRLGRDERAITMLTSSDTEALRLIPSPGVDPTAHGVYRVRRGTPLVVLTLSNFSPAPEGRSYQAWAHLGGRWISLGTARPDAQRKARLVVEGAGYAERPDAVEVTLEPYGGSSAPSGPVLIRWPAP